MKLSIVSVICIAIWCLSAKEAHSQGTTVSDDTSAVSSGLGAFSIELLAKTAVEGGNELNVVISTYSVWNLLAILNEGAGGSTSNQLKAALRAPNTNQFRVGYKAIGSALMSQTPGVDLSISSAIFTDRNKQLSKEFQYQTSQQYKVNFLPVNFQDRVPTAQYIDSYIANATNNRLKHFINYDDLADAQLLLTTAIFFKGAWTSPFNVSATTREPFYDETMQRKIGEVNMMYQSAPFAYVLISNLKALAVELPYGRDEKYSMVVLLPQQGVALSTFLTQLTTVTFQSILDELDEAKEEYFGEDVDVYLPKFTVTSDFVLNVVLEQMGILDVFDPNYANLMKISNDNFYLSRVIHKAEIEVTEEGTVASAASGGTISYKQPTPAFRANRPFVYFILEKSTKTLLFAGKISNPNDL